MEDIGIDRNRLRELRLSDGRCEFKMDAFRKKSRHQLLMDLELIGTQERIEYERLKLNKL